jgi:alcohol dehydrogenase class IV
MSQGANPWSDVGCEAALRKIGAYLERGVNDASDREARDNLMFAATLAGIAFGNSGVHVPHGMAYAVAGLVREYHPDGYPGKDPIVPHGMSVIVNAPSVFRFTSEACPERHLDGARFLGADVRGAAARDAGEILAKQLVAMMRATGIPNGIGGVGYGERDLGALSEGAYAQQRLMTNSPREITKDNLGQLFRGALAYW